MLLSGLGTPGRPDSGNMSLATSSPAVPAKFEAVHLDFESGTLDGWSCKRLAGPHSAVIQSDVVRQGRFACRFELRPEDYVSQGHRAELRDLYNVRWDEEVWYGFTSYLSEDHHVSGDIACVIAQWHDQAKLGDPSGKPPIALRYRDGRLGSRAPTGVRRRPSRTSATSLRASPVSG